MSFTRCIREWNKEHEIEWRVVKRTFICKARTMIVNDAIDIGADYILWLDDDAVIRPDVLPRLLSHDKDIVITPYPLRCPPYLCGVLKSTIGDFENQASWVNLDWEDLNRGLIEVDGGGTHCMLTKTKIYGPHCTRDEKGQTEPMEEYKKRCPGQTPYPWFVLSPFGGTEDIYFCIMAKRAGLKIYCDSDLEVGHMGYPQIITSGNAISWQKKYGKRELHDVLKDMPEGLRYIDVGDVGNSEAPPTMKNTLGASAEAGDGREPAI